MAQKIYYILIDSFATLNLNNFIERELAMQMYNFVCFSSKLSLDLTHFHTLGSMFSFTIILLSNEFLTSYGYIEYSIFMTHLIDSNLVRI